MFPLRKLRIKCPTNCQKAYCLFIHSQSPEPSQPPPKPKKRITPQPNPIPKPEKKVKSSGPQVSININTTVKHKNRQKALDKFYIEFTRIYAKLQNESLIIEHSLKQEEVCKNSTDLSYTNTIVSVLRRLRSRKDANDINDVGIDGEYKPILIESIPLTKLKSMVLNSNQMNELKYPKFEMVSKLSEINNQRTCDRCGNQFNIDSGIDLSCTYHPKPYYKQYQCCKSELGTPGCATGPHVFKLSLDAELHYFIPFERFPKGDVGVPVVALDCEMGYTEIGMELLRVSIVDWYGHTLLDTLVNPKYPIRCLNSMYSGVDSLKGVTESIETIKSKLKSIISTDTILIGHGLENDLRCLRFVHDNVIDTVQLFPHEKGLPFRKSLKNLVREKLGMFIQDGQHDSVEDAVVCIELVKTLIK